VFFLFTWVICNGMSEGWNNPSERKKTTHNRKKHVLVCFVLCSFPLVSCFHYKQGKENKEQSEQEEKWMKNQKNQIKLKAKVSEKWTHALLLFYLLFCALHSCVVVLLIWFISCFPHFVQSIINEPNKRTKNTHNKSSIWRTCCVIVLLFFLSFSCNGKEVKHELNERRKEKHKTQLRMKREKSTKEAREFVKRARTSLASLHILLSFWLFSPFILPSWLLPSRLNRLTPRDRGWWLVCVVCSLWLNCNGLNRKHELSQREQHKTPNQPHDSDLA